ncbi:hypothetical protein HYALB_00010945 [Hymenoscyphus albidus]|uniref:Uncharacterized protein n=1 Tax=Hymenoscyphus albidus TaxID=595503 RepID=A0A9N9PVY3_9HELO|nr:hypothetical protein HYALB_00010945 [Hymenoscyphus albidus]
MFEVPDAKRVRRSDLYAHSRSPSRTSSPEVQDEAALRERERIANERFAELFGGVEFITTTATTKITNATERKPSSSESHSEADEEGGGGGEKEFEFRLFSTGNESNTEGERAKATQKIILVDEEGEELGEGAFVGKGRGEEYYFWDANATEGGKEGFERVAVSEEDILKIAATRHWGLEVPWRVTVLKSVGKTKRGKEVLVIEGQDRGGKKKPGKKRRIILRKRQKAIEEAKEKKRLEEERKEEGEKEKRTKRNREKKIKRRLKEKAEKALKSEAGEINGDSKEETISGPSI